MPRLTDENGIPTQAGARAMFAAMDKVANRPADYCAACAKHYGDDGQCDDGKPPSSPHRNGVPKRRLAK